VCDFKSWPGGKGKDSTTKHDWELLLKCHGFKDEAEALAYRQNPVDNLEPLARAKIPIIHVVGQADTDVPVRRTPTWSRNATRNWAAPSKSSANPAWAITRTACPIRNRS
jgi:hypothetical protein